MTAELSGLLRAHPLPPLEDGGKGSRDNLVIVGGAPSCPGSALLAGLAALRCGSGRVQLIVHPEVAPALGVAFPEALVLGWDHTGEPPDAVIERLEVAGAVIVGPGLDDGAPETAIAVSRHVGDGVLVVDARAVAAITDHDLDRRGPRLVAPNPAEARRLLGAHDNEEEDVAVLAQHVAALVDGPAAVRGATTVIDDRSGRQWEERSAVPGLGTPGSGDVLMGALGACIVRGAPLAAALGWAVAAHACAGTLLAQERPVGFLAREIAEALPVALQHLAAEEPPPLPDPPTEPSSSSAASKRHGLRFTR